MIAKIAFDSKEHFAIFIALRKIDIHETFVKIIGDIYAATAASISIDKMTSKPLHSKIGVRHGDPISPKLFPTAMHEIFKKTNIEEIGMINYLRFANDVAIVNFHLRTHPLTELNEQRKYKTWDENSQGKNNEHDINEQNNGYKNRPWETLKS